MESSPARIRIIYCPKCKWMLRSAWYAQELLETFASDIIEVTLAPDYDCGGRFEIHVDQHLVWERVRDGGFPGIKVLKRKIRDIIQPDRDLGHLDRDQA